MVMWWLCILALLGCVHAQWEPQFHEGRSGIVHLFEWHWDTIANECETVLGPSMFAGVQISPPNENRIVGNRPWWERYQPISYKLETRSGNRVAFANMVERCNYAGVRIYADIVINHMCGDGGSGTGTGGSYFDTSSRDFPGVPYSNSDFNDGKCNTASGNIENYGDAEQVRNCKLVNLIDLNQGKDYVRDRIVDFMNDLTSLGVAGYRVDACKHMWPGDLGNIYGRLADLPTSHGFAPGAKPFIFQEVIDQGGEPITAGEYTGLGRVTEFKYGINLANNKNDLHNLNTFGESWGMMDGMSAVVFLNNHDNQRGHGGGGSLITFEDPYTLKMMNAFMMAHPYGEPRVMSSYYFSNGDEGPPGEQPNAWCDNGWVCEHRWRQIRNMAAFAGVARGQALANWWSDYNQIAFSRGNAAFIAINNAGSTMDHYLQTGMPGGDYCNVIAGDVGSCDGSCVQVDASGYAHIFIPAGSDPLVAIHVNAPCSCDTEDCGSNTVAPPTNPPGGGSCADCNSCTSKLDCGYMGIDQYECEGSGCLWCPMSDGSSDPWCIEKSGSSGGGGGGSCSVADNSKLDCGYLGVDQNECEGSGCCWAESNTNGIPWCYYPI